MTWFKVDDGLHSHRKWLATSLAARGLWVTAGSWCADQLTDGHIPTHVLRQLGGRPRDAAELVTNGLWDALYDGWRFHSWHDFQPSRESVESDRAAARERQRRARERAKSREGNAGPVTQDGQTVNPTTSVNSTESRRDSHVNNGASHGPPDPTRPDPITSRGATTPTTQPPGTPPDPRRCPAHQAVDGTVPPCGACADKRRNHDRTTPPPATHIPPPVEDVRLPDTPIENNGTGPAAARAALRHQETP